MQSIGTNATFIISMYLIKSWSSYLKNGLFSFSKIHNSMTSTYSTSIFQELLRLIWIKLNCAGRYTNIVHLNNLFQINWCRRGSDGGNFFPRNLDLFSSIPKYILVHFSSRKLQIPQLFWILTVLTFPRLLIADLQFFFLLFQVPWTLIEC